MFIWSLRTNTSYVRNRYTPFGRNSGLAGGDKKHGVEAYTVRIPSYLSPLIIVNIQQNTPANELSPFSSLVTVSARLYQAKTPSLFPQPSNLNPPS